MALAVHQADIQNYLLQTQELTPDGKSQLRAYDFIGEFKTVSFHLNLSSPNFISHFIIHSTQHCKILLQIITDSSCAHYGQPTSVTYLLPLFFSQIC